MNLLRKLLLLPSLFVSTAALATDFPTSARAEKSIANVAPQLKKELTRKGLEYGSPIFIRIFKNPGVLEVWVESNRGTFVHFKDYDIPVTNEDACFRARVGIEYKA